MKRTWTLVAAALAAIATPSAAQYVSEAEGFIKAVHERDGDKAVQAIEGRPTIVNARNGKGETALVIAVQRRDSDWTRFLLGKGAKPDLASVDGETPLIAAARVGFDDAADRLLRAGADPNKANRLGETPLIVAVQRRELGIIKLLMAKGADPDITDNAAGYSARDYARRDSRARGIMELIEAPQKKEEKAEKASDELNGFDLKKN